MRCDPEYIEIPCPDCEEESIKDPSFKCVTCNSTRTLTIKNEAYPKPRRCDNDDDNDHIDDDDK